MISLLEKLIDLILGWLGYLLPFYVLGDDTVGLVRRLGEYHRDLEPGWNWKIPIVEEVQDVSKALDSIALRSQTLTTQDGFNVTLRVVIAYQVTNARTYILGCNDASSIMNDVGVGVIGELVPRTTLAVVMGDKFHEDCLKAMRERAKTWGVKMRSCGFADRVVARTYRVLVGDA